MRLGQSGWWKQPRVLLLWFLWVHWSTCLQRANRWQCLKALLHQRPSWELWADFGSPSTASECGWPETRGSLSAKSLRLYIPRPSAGLATRSPSAALSTPFSSPITRFHCHFIVPNAEVNHILLQPSVSCLLRHLQEMDANVQELEDQPNSSRPASETRPQKETGKKKRSISLNCDIPNPSAHGTFPHGSPSGRAEQRRTALGTGVGYLSVSVYLCVYLLKHPGS